MDFRKVVPTYVYLPEVIVVLSKYELVEASKRICSRTYMRAKVFVRSLMIFERCSKASRRLWYKNVQNTRAHTSNTSQGLVGFLVR